MKKVLFYSGFLALGILVSQVFNLASARSALHITTMIFLSYIMIGVGQEFSLDKTRLKSYAWDYVVAMTAAAFPWIFCAVYFIVVFSTEWREAFLVGRFAAPTSAGVLFAMLAAAGLGGSWLFKKAQVLAIFDDLDTVLLMIPLQAFFVGLRPELFIVLTIVLGLLWLAYKFLHGLNLSNGKIWILVYAVCITFLCWEIEHRLKIPLEVLLPAFAFGAILKSPRADGSQTEEREHETRGIRVMDEAIKIGFMFLVGCSLPKIALGSEGVVLIILHVLALTILANLGKCFPALCYRSEATIKERIALAIAMFPRGEVGAGVLLIAINYGLEGTDIAYGGLSLALNLLLSGVFIAWVLRLLRSSKTANK